MVPRQIVRHLQPAWALPCDARRTSQPNELAIRTTLNGEVMQDWNTNDMIFDVPTLIEFLSGSTTLPAGTVILTGTPHGVGMARNRRAGSGPAMSSASKSRELEHSRILSPTNSCLEVDLFIPNNTITSPADGFPLDLVDKRWVIMWQKPVQQ